MSIHLIRIPDKESRIRALAIFGRIQKNRVRLPGDIMGVTGEHVQVLRDAQIPFEFVSKQPAEDGKTAASI